MKFLSSLLGRAKLRTLGGKEYFCLVKGGKHGPTMVVGQLVWSAPNEPQNVTNENRQELR